MSGDLLVRGISRLLPMTGPGADGTAVIGAAAVLLRGGQVAWTGPERDLPAGPEVPEVDAGGAVVLPGFVDPHTHLLWAGDRRGELAARLRGDAYDGGGIAVTCAATAAAGDEELLAAAAARLGSLLAGGTTTVEVKTGYGGRAAAELRLVGLLEVLAGRVPTRLELTYLVHLPPADDAARDGFCAEHARALPEARARGARWLDVFCDTGAFTVAEARALLAAGAAAGLGGRLHAEQLSRIGAAALAADTGCASADHLDRLDAAGARALAAAGTVAVLLPTAGFTTGGTRPDLGVLRAAGVELALGTDCNPGTSWCTSTATVLQHACFGLGLTVEEALVAATRGGASALRRTDVGTLAVGAAADLVVHGTDHEAELVGRLGEHPARVVVLDGRVVLGPGRDQLGSSLQSSRASSASTST